MRPIHMTPERRERAQRHLDQLAVEQAHDERHAEFRRLAGQRARLQAELDRLDATPWYRQPSGRQYDLRQAIDKVDEVVHQLEVDQQWERVSGDILLPERPVATTTSRRGLPPSWYLPPSGRGTRSPAATSGPARPPAGGPRRPARASVGQRGMVVTSLAELPEFWQQQASSAIREHFDGIRAAAAARQRTA